MKFLGKLKRVFKASGYGDAGASTRKRSLRGFRAKSKSARSDIDIHNGTMRSRGRALFMAAPLATSAIKSLRTSVVGPGLHLHAQVDKAYLNLTDEQASALNKEIETEFELWAADCRSASLSGLHDFYELQQLAIMSWKVSGDVFCLFHYADEEDPMQPYSMRIQLIEADRISTPMNGTVAPMLTYGKDTVTGNEIFDGVEVDEVGKVLAYHICNSYPAEFSGKSVEWVRVAAYGEETGLPNILHIMDAERTEQYRGITCLAPIIENLLMLDRYVKSESAAAMLESYFTLYVESDADNDAPPIMPSGNRSRPGDDEEEDEDRPTPHTQEEYELGSNAVVFMNPGEKIKSVQPSRPNSQFDGFTRAVAMHIGAALEIPVDVLLKSYNSSYSASRAALQDFWRMVRMVRDIYSTRFCGGVYEVWFAEAVALGRIDAPGFFTDPRARMAYLNHEWNGPAMPHLDPVKEATAMEKMVDRGWVTNTQATTQLNGGDYMTNLDQLEKENKRLVPILMLSAAVDAKRKQESQSQPQEENASEN